MKSANETERTNAMTTKTTIKDATKTIRDLAKQDRSGEVDDSYARTHDAEDTIRRWRAASAEAGDLGCVEAIDRLGIARAATVYESARAEMDR